MHYYQHNIGDYARDTGHLSVLEHGIYRLLLDWCYLNEKPITTEQAIRIARGNHVETQSVLSEFFQQTDEGWTHKRVQREVAYYHDKAQKNRQNGSKGGRPKANANPVGSQTDANRNPNQEPITNNQEPSTERSERKRPPSFDAASIELPEWLPRDVWEAWCSDRKKRGKAVTERAAQLQIRQLGQYRQDGSDPEAVINYSIAGGYQGLYPTKAASKTQAKSSKHSGFEQMDYTIGVNDDGSFQ